MGYWGTPSAPRTAIGTDSTERARGSRPALAPFVVALTLGLGLASGGHAASSLKLEATAPGSSDAVLTWESDTAGPFDLLRKDIPLGARPEDFLPLDPLVDLAQLGVTSPLVLPGAADPAQAGGTTMYGIVDSAGGCSNVGYIARIPWPRRPIVNLPGWLEVAPPFRTSLHSAEAFLDHVADAATVLRWDVSNCRWVALRRLPAGGGYDGENFFVGPGDGVVLTPARDTTDTVVLLGAAEPRKPDLDIDLTSVSCAPRQAVRSLPYGTQRRDASELLCGFEGSDWVDGDGDGYPDTCPAGMFQDEAFGELSLLKAPFHAQPDEHTFVAVRKFFGVLAFTGGGWDVEPGIPWHLRIPPTALPRPAWVTTDAGALAACTCADSDGDGDDDCTERLLGTDPMNPASSGPDVDGDGRHDHFDTCPLDFDPAGTDSDADGVGDPCDPCPLDPTDACVDLDGDGVPRAADSCPDDTEPPHVLSEYFDSDFIGRACDLCRGGIDDLDTDGDGVPDECDCAPLDATVGRVPPDVVDLRAERSGFGVSLTWTDNRILPDEYFQVSVGNIDRLAPDGLTSSTCEADLVTVAMHADPTPGSRWYLVRMANDCGTGLARGRWGRSGAGSIRDQRLHVDLFANPPCQ